MEDSKRERIMDAASYLGTFFEKYPSDPEYSGVYGLCGILFINFPIHSKPGSLIKPCLVVVPEILIFWEKFRNLDNPFFHESFYEKLDEVWDTNWRPICVFPKSFMEKNTEC